MSDDFHVVVLRLDLTIPGARSLKDRRQAVKSLKERLAHRFGVACAEVGDLDVWTRATLGLTACANDKQFLVERAEEIVRYAGNDKGVLLQNAERDYFCYGAAP